MQSVKSRGEFFSVNKKASLDVLCFPSRTMHCMGPSPNSNVCDCRSILATDRQIVFLLERQRQAPFYIHCNQYACIHACSGESAGVVLYHFIEVCRNIRHTHRELQTKHLGSAILSIPLWMCSEEPIFVIKSSPCQQPWRSFCRRGCRPQQAQKKALHVNSKVTR